MEKTQFDLNGTELIVKFEGVQLSKDEASRLSKVIQKAVMHELPSLEAGHHVRAMLPKEWLGIWLDLIGTKPNIPNIVTGPRG